MAKRHSRPDRPLEPRLPVVIVCRGGDCGSQRKHRNTEHAAQRTRFRHEVNAATATVTVSKCLDACDFSNVVVIIPGAAGREAGMELAWVGGVLDDAITIDLIDWVNEADLEQEAPTLVQIQQFHPTRQSRRELSAPETLPGYRR